MGRSVAVFVPFLPTKYLSPNRGERREGRVPALIVESKRAMRGAWALWLLEQDAVRAIKEPFSRATLTLTVRCMDGRAVVPADGVYRPLDVGNAIYALKSGIDGVKDAGLIVDDDWRHLEAVTGRIERVSDRASEGVLVTVCEVAG